MSPRKPLEGVYVLDMTQVWAGPMVTRMLASFGATVIKIEGPTRPDTLRTLGWDLPQRFPDGDRGLDPENRNAWFNTQNHGKLGVLLDIRAPEGLALVERLAQRCQVLVSNSRSGAMAKLGLGYDRYRELRGPDAVVAEMSAFGATGERAKLAGFGLQFEAAAAGPWLIGDEQPVLTGYAVADAVGGVATAGAIMTAVLHARRTGIGSYIDASLVEAYLSTMGDVVLEATLGQNVIDRYGANRHPGAAPHGIFPVGDGRWLAVGVHTDQQWQALVKVSADPTIAAPEWASADDRERHIAPLHVAVAQWTKAQPDAARLEALLQDVGVPAAVVATAADVARNPFLASTDYYAEVTHPSTGTHRYPGLPYSVDGRHLAPGSPAPCWGEHTDQVLSGLLGLDEAELADLADRGIIGRSDAAFPE
ncbi:CaiB/BaiF CoA transferase family protein [Rhodococcus koreensis]|uniref:CaiB/BaiF CoA transferase family protein n=1 Tax=Rhodococcus koreensis TaxID=99653 RepID=UPI00366BB0D2